jgi:hypothetical protein
LDTSSEGWIPGGLALLGFLALVLGWNSLRKRRSGRAQAPALLALCFCIASEGAAVATAVLGRLGPWDDAPAPMRLASSARRARNVGNRLVGTRAQDFTLPALTDGHPVHLAEHWSRRPLVLVFGNFG